MKLKELKEEIDKLNDIVNDDIEIKFNNKPLDLEFKMKEINGENHLDTMINNAGE